MEIEHDIWLRDNLINGYEYAKDSNDRLAQHRDVNTLEGMPPEDRQLDEVIVEGIPDVLAEGQYTLSKKPKQRRD